MDYSGQGWQVELQCPQCGGPIVLEETDRILSCSFCRVRLFLACRSYPRYYMAPRNVPLENVLFLPYWRFRGLAFSYKDNNELQQKIVDSSLLALKARGLPLSLGVRPQVLKLKFATSSTEGRFLKPHFPFNKLPSKSGDPSGFVASSGRNLPGLYEAFIGETLSLIYSPMVIERGVLCDAILRQPLAQIPEGLLDKLPSDKIQHNSLELMPTICPHCGWDLQGEKDTLVLLCRNCDSAWVSSENGLKSLNFAVMQSPSESAVYLPFWQIRAEIFGVKLRSQADLVRLANLPMAVTNEMEERPVYFRIPAFKVQPQLFLRLAKLLTISQKQTGTAEIPGEWPKSDKARIHPVTLPVHEAEESICVTMASFAVPKVQFIPKLHEIKVKVVDYMLTYLPFELGGSELIQQEMQISISGNALRLGRLI